MRKATYTILSVLSCFFDLTTSVQYPFCPKEADLQPCTCDEEGFNCRNAKDEETIQKALTAKSTEVMARSMYIQGTPIKRLAKGIFGGFQFSEFHIDVNQITEVESGVFEGSAAIVIIVSLFGNKLETFPFEDVHDLPHLMILSLTKNKFYSIPARAFGFKEHKGLTELHLSDNNIYHIGRRAFSNLPNLKKLHLDRNRLRILENEALDFPRGVKIEQINLSNNELNYIANLPFWEVDVRQLDLQNNSLTYLRDQPFKDLLLGVNKGAKVLVGGNPFTCTGCDQYKWIVDNQQRLSQSIVGMKCTNGATFGTLTLEIIEC